jgi:hypothetical protein
MEEKHQGHLLLMEVEAQQAGARHAESANSPASEVLCRSSADLGLAILFPHIRVALAPGEMRAHGSRAASLFPSPRPPNRVRSTATTFFLPRPRETCCIALCFAFQYIGTMCTPLNASWRHHHDPDDPRQLGSDVHCAIHAQHVLQKLKSRRICEPTVSHHKCQALMSEPEAYICTN